MKNRPGDEQELLPMFKDEDDRIFARTLFRRALLDSNDNKKLIEQFTRNWEIERIAFNGYRHYDCSFGRDNIIPFDTIAGIIQ